MGVFSENTYGSILQMNYWWIMTNDLLILSIILNRMHVHIGSPRLKSTIYVSAKSRPKYSIVNMPQISKVGYFSSIFSKK